MVASSPVKVLGVLSRNCQFQVFSAQLLKFLLEGLLVGGSVVPFQDGEAIAVPVLGVGLAALLDDVVGGMSAVHEIELDVQGEREPGVLVQLVCLGKIEAAESNKFLPNVADLAGIFGTSMALPPECRGFDSHRDNAHSGDNPDSF